VLGQVPTENLVHGSRSSSVVTLPRWTGRAELFERKCEAEPH